MLNIRFELSGTESVIEGLFSEVEKRISSGLLNVLKTAETKAKEIVPRRTGRLRDSISFYLGGKRKGALVSNAPYSSYLHEGTGLYGPSKRRVVIVPGRKKALSWPGARHPVGKVTIKGIKGRPFLKDALSGMEDSFEEGFK